MHKNIMYICGINNSIAYEPAPKGQPKYHHSKITA